MDLDPLFDEYAFFRLFGDFRGTPRPIHGGPTIG
jgi:hypothetical protein